VAAIALRLVQVLVLGLVFVGDVVSSRETAVISLCFCSVSAKMFACAHHNINQRM